MGTVCAAALLGGLVDLDVLDDQVGGIETLGVGVGLGVLQETEEELGGLDGPTGARDTELLAYLRAPLLALTLPLVAQELTQLIQGSKFIAPQS